MKPTAYLHVDCNGHNKEDGFLSDVRFEHLEKGSGNVLVINDAGYVLDSKVSLADLAKSVSVLQQGYDQEKEKNNRLEQELQDLRARLNVLLTGSGNGQTSASVLYQNTPNPFDKETTISFNIDQVKASAYLAVYDLNGKELTRFAITQKGKGAIKVNAGLLTPGMYLYALVVDGVAVDTKKMVMSK